MAKRKNATSKSVSKMEKCNLDLLKLTSEYLLPKEKFKFLGLNKKIRMKFKKKTELFEEFKKYKREFKKKICTSKYHCKEQCAKDKITHHKFCRNDETLKILTDEGKERTNNCDKCNKKFCTFCHTKYLYQCRKEDCYKKYCNSCANNNMECKVKCPSCQKKMCEFCTQNRLMSECCRSAEKEKCCKKAKAFVPQCPFCLKSGCYEREKDKVSCDKCGRKACTKCCRSESNTNQILRSSDGRRKCIKCIQGDDWDRRYYY
jgi:hypothetical protein